MGSHLPVEPLREAVKSWMRRSQRTYEDLAEQVGVSYRTIIRLAEKDSVHEQLADRVCLAMGLHPLQIYGTATWHGEDDEGEPLAARRKPSRVYGGLLRFSRQCRLEGLTDEELERTLREEIAADMARYRPRDWPNQDETDVDFS